MAGNVVEGARLEENSAGKSGDHLAKSAGESFAWPETAAAEGNPHRPECERHPAAAAMVPSIGFTDHFCECHDFPEPRVLRNGTDIAWPRGWSQEDAMRWRAAHKLLPVSG